MTKIVKKICINHGLTDFILEGRGSYRCRKCRVDATTKRRRILKRKAVDYKGGCCQECGYRKSIYALEFHHRDPTKKDFGIGSGNTNSWEKTIRELDKCIMLCANCHREKHQEIRSALDKKKCLRFDP